MGTNHPTAPHPVLEKYYPSAEHRQEFVSNLFDGAARHYNRLGQLLDLGSGSWYRRQALRRAGLRPGMRLLDVATGTGLVARGAEAVLDGSGRVIGVDPSHGMLQEARKALASSLVQARAEALPFRDDLFDMLSMGFALRHVAGLEVAFHEYRRVLKRGGRIVLLEVSRPASPVSRWLIRTHLQRVLPFLARIGTRSPSAVLLMKFYWDTIDQCVPSATILDVLQKTRFVDVGVHRLCGFLNEYVAMKPLR